MCARVCVCHRGDFTSDPEIDGLIKNYIYSVDARERERESRARFFLENGVRMNIEEVYRIYENRSCLR